MTHIWAPLEAEFDLWRAADMRLPFWWRDDDAVSVTPALDQLAALAVTLGIDVHLAVIPANLQPDLAPYVAQNPRLIPVAHGYAHQNHAPVGVKKCEFPPERDGAALQHDVSKGYETLKTAFGEQFIPMFVPPWNRFAQTHISRLQDVGYKGFSTSGARPAKWADRGVEQINIHVDPINWHGGRSLLDGAEIIQRAVDQLVDRRFGQADNTEPFGFLTHHLIHDAAIWAFSEAFLTKFIAGPVVLWSAEKITQKETE